MANMAVLLIVAAYCLTGQLVGLHGGFMMNGVIMLLSSTPKNWFRLLCKKFPWSEYCDFLEAHQQSQ